MQKIIVRGGQPLFGRVPISGSKNAVLPIIAASLLAENGWSRIQDAPHLEDVATMSSVLQSLGVRTHHDHTFSVNAEHVHSFAPPDSLIRRMRASFLVMGPLLARFGFARIALPGGCAIGMRPIDQHLKGFEAMGAEIEVGQGAIEARVRGPRLHGAKVYLDVASVGATENIMMAAALAAGTTVIENAAKEPEVVDLANFLNAMGAKVRGAGTDIIKIDGVEQLTGAEHVVIPDRIEAGTYMVAAAITGGRLYLEGAIGDHLMPVISKLQEMGVRLEEDENGIMVDATVSRLRPVDVKTLPYPGFPTDMQSPIMALLLTVEGASLVTETVFENRYMHVNDFRKMKARIKVDGQLAFIQGGNRLRGAVVEATDLRAGAALVLAGLAAEGETVITGIHHIQRGYVELAQKLSQVGASISEVDSAAEVEEQSELTKLFAAQPTLA